MKPCRLLTYTASGNFLAEASLSSVHAAVWEGYKTGLYFHVIEKDGPLHLLWNGCPEDVTRKFADGSEAEGKFTKEQIENMLEGVE